MVKKISIVVPAYNADDNIEQCLMAIYSQNYPEYEVIVVNDYSGNKLSSSLKNFPCRILELNEHSGAAVARNEGVKNATSDVIFFLDADVLIQGNGLQEVADTFEKYPDVDVVQGVYAQIPGVNNLSSLTKNYYKYHKIQRIIQPQIYGINSYCFAIKKKVFEDVGGFNPKYEKVEDVELGMRLVGKGYKIFLNKNLVVKHLKHYTFFGLLKTDYGKICAKTNLLLDNFFNPSSYIKHSAEITFSLNRKKGMNPEFISIFLTPFITVGIVFATLLKNFFLFFLSIVLFILFVLLNFSFLNLIKKNNGLLSTIGCFFVYYSEIVITFVAGFNTVLLFFVKGKLCFRSG